MSALAVLFLAVLTLIRAATGAKPPQGVTPPVAGPLARLTDPRGPVLTLNSLSDDELLKLLDALYRNLDTSAPEPAALLWYEVGVEECRLRKL